MSTEYRIYPEPQPGDVDYAPCHVILPTGEPVRVRCIRDSMHRGAHWSHVEPVPNNCRCKLFCYCGDPRFA